MRRTVHALTAVVFLTMPVGAQNADLRPGYLGPDFESSDGGSSTRGPGCPGGESGRADLQLQTDNNGHIGIQYVPSLDIYCSSSRGVGEIPPHLLYKLDNMGRVIGQVEQIPEADSDPWGYRDLACDGRFLYGGWEGGVARHRLDGTGGELFISGAPPGIRAWSGLAYDPSGDDGNGSLWVSDFSRELIEVSMSGTLLAATPISARNGRSWGLPTTRLPAICGATKVYARAKSSRSTFRTDRLLRADLRVWASSRAASPAIAAARDPVATSRAD